MLFAGLEIFSHFHTRRVWLSSHNLTSLVCMSSFLSFWFTVNILPPVSASSNICCWTRLAPRVMCENRKKKEKNVQPGRSIWLQLEGSTSETWAPFSLHLKNKQNILLWTFYECVFYPYCTSKRCKNASNDLDFQWWYRSPSECTWSGKQFKQNPSQTTSFRWNHPCIWTEIHLWNHPWCNFSLPL